MAESEKSRYLRPTRLVAGGALIWAVDEVQPVAALLDATTGAVRRVVSWPELPPPPVNQAWRILGAGPDLWVQPGPGAPVARIDPQGKVHGGYSAGRWLAAVEPRGAWCIDQYKPQLFVSNPEERPHPLVGEQVIVIAGDGQVRRVWVDRPVREVHVTGEGDAAVVHLGVHAATHTDAHLGATTWEISWRRAWLRVPPGPVPAHLKLADAEVGMPAPAAGEQSPQADLGAGRVLATAGSDTGLWISMRRPPGADRSRTAPIEVLRLDPTSDAVTAVLAGDSIDISDRCWPRGRPPVDAMSYARSQRDRYADLDNAWFHAETGAASALTADTSRWTAELTGSWPDTELILSFDNRRYPGLRLRRHLGLFDELGRPVPPEFADIHLMEDIETRRLPPAAAAVDGVLTV